MKKPAIYLDFAAATPMDDRVLKVMEPYFTEYFYNPSATYLASKSTKQALEQARSNIAKILGAKPSEIIFTAGATEANNLAIKGVAQTLKGGEILVGTTEHDSVILPAKSVGASLIPVKGDGQIDLVKMQSMISDKTVLISIGFVNNELGTIQDMRAIAKIIKEVTQMRLQKNQKLPLYFHTDAAQAGNLFDLHVSRLGVDMLSLNGGKIYGPKQSGILYINSTVKLAPQIMGGGQEFGLRSGTENVAADVGLAEALTIAQNSRQTEIRRISSLRQEFIKMLKEKIPTVIINGPINKISPHIISASFPGSDNERLVMELDEAGIEVAVGSACSASSQEPSHVLKAIGLPKKQIYETLRFSLGRHSNLKEIETVVKTLAKITASNR